MNQHPVGLSSAISSSSSGYANSRRRVLPIIRVKPKKSWKCGVHCTVFSLFLGFSMFSFVTVIWAGCVLEDYLHSTQHESAGGLSLPIPTKQHKPTKVLTAYFDDATKSKAFPRLKKCSRLFRDFPVDDYPTQDPYLPWIHDYFPTNEGQRIQFVAQNKRRCDTGVGNEDTMKYWEPQMALFQPIPVALHPNNNSYVVSSHNAIANETRFQCRFHTLDRDDYPVTFSQFSFNYEYVTWRKGKNEMFNVDGKDSEQFWLSQLLFYCPVPTELQPLFRDNHHVSPDDTPQVWLDLIPIRVPPRNGKFLFQADHVGPFLDKLELYQPPRLELPPVEKTGRWANLPICEGPSATTTTTTTATTKPNRLVACTWTSSKYTRRGNVVTVQDSGPRLREWIQFHLVVGFDHLYVYDNTSPNATDDTELLEVAQEFSSDLVTYHRWPCQLCNNNRPNFKNPGERSSQYAAEASCRERYGPYTDWMAFLDTDEYLVPMRNDTWDSVLDEMEERKIHILKMKSSRGKPRGELMEVLEDQSTCKDTSTNARKNVPTEPCLGPRQNETFLRVYNCEFIKPPRPERFARAMKQIYRPDHVLSHFVHYSTVTRDIAQYYKDVENPSENFIRSTHRKDWQENAPEIFLDELTQGTLVHTRSVLPHETRRRSSECYLNSKYNCIIGHLCPDWVEFVDGQHSNNAFHYNGTYCNCWKNPRVEDYFVPKLEQAMAMMEL